MMQYCIRFHNILLNLVEENGTILRISFVRKCSFQNSAYFAKILEGYWRGNNTLLKYQLPASYKKFESIFERVQEIPFGRVSSYGNVANTVFGSKKYARLVGTAMKNNPLPIIVPCHRVIRSDGSIGGFSGGVDIKMKLLQLEGMKLHNGYIKKEYFIDF